MRKGERCHHHIKNRCNGGVSKPENLLYIYRTRERLIHDTYGSRDLYEIAEYLLRIMRLQRRGYRFMRKYELKIEYTKKIFGDNKTLFEIIIFILRIARAKHFERINPEIKKLYKKFIP